MTLATTIDGLLNRRVSLEQPEKGFRVAVDTVFLAASVPALARQTVLDTGCGVGGAALCLAARVAGLAIKGVDFQPELIDIFRRNIERNDFAKGIEAVTGDVAALPAVWEGLFDHVMANPPYHEAARHDRSPDKIKGAANTEEEGDLRLWIAAAARVLKTGGQFTLIHRADRKDEILDLLRDGFGAVETLALLPKMGSEAKRMIFRARRGAAWGVQECAPLVLHRAEGGYSEEADAILRHAQPLAFNEPA